MLSLIQGFLFQRHLSQDPFTHRETYTSRLYVYFVSSDKEWGTPRPRHTHHRLLHTCIYIPCKAHLRVTASSIETHSVDVEFNDTQHLHQTSYLSSVLTVIRTHQPTNKWYHVRLRYGFYLNQLIRW